MLQISRVFPGAPNAEAGVGYLLHNERMFVVYASQSNVILLTTPSLHVHRVLAFFEAFPGFTHLEATISAVTADSDNTLIAASVGSQIAFWVPSSGDGWRVHSTLNISQPVRAMHHQAGRLLVSTDGSLSVWEQREETGLALWRKVWEDEIDQAPLIARLSETGTFVAWAFPCSKLIHITNTHKHTHQHLPHPRPISSLAWRRPTAGNRSSLTLFTLTSDHTVRIWQPVLDAPSLLRLWATLDAWSFVDVDGGRAEHVRWVEKLARPTDEKEFGAGDVFVGVDEGGKIALRSVSNIERRPPTLLTTHPARPLPSSLPLPLPSTPTSPLLILPVPSSNSLAMFLSPSSLAATSLPLSPPPTSEHVDEPPVRAAPFGQQHTESIIRMHLGSHRDAFVTWSSGEVIYWDGSCAPPKNVAKWSVACQLTAVVDDGVLVCSENQLRLLRPEGEQLTGSIPGGEVRAILNSTLHLLAITDTHCFELSRPTLSILATSLLPDSSVKLRIPIQGHNREILNVRDDGELAFWRYWKGHWTRIGGISTGRRGVGMGACSVQRRSALVNTDVDGHHLSIWNSRLSEFSSGLEFEKTFSDEIVSLCWTYHSSEALAVCFPTHVLILWPERVTYFDTHPAWSSSFLISLAPICPLPMTNVTFLSTGSLAVTAGNEVFVYGRKIEPRAGYREKDLFELITSRVGPLPDWHPQMMLQCLLWNKVDRVKEVIERMARVILKDDGSAEDMAVGLRTLGDAPYRDEEDNPTSKTVPDSSHMSLFSQYEEEEYSTEDFSFSRSLVMRLLDALEGHCLPDLTINEQEHLEALIETTLQIDEQRRALDANGVRYLISVRSFYILNRKSMEMAGTATPAGGPPTIEGRSRIRYRDMVWAYHSESQDLLLQACSEACGGKMTWNEARSLCLFLWITSNEVLKEQMETVARNEYMAGDNRDPEACSLYYFALGKRRLVHGLWKQAAWHPEQTLMVKFLANDFDLPRWKTAALKNAYALLGRKRYRYAAAFFLLGGAVSDAVNVCIKQLGDFQLAIALARICERGDNGPILRDLLMKTVIPLAFKEDNRWLGSWAFWMLHQRDLAVRIILTPLTELAKTLKDVPIESIGKPYFDDPSLAILFSQLKAKTLQAAKGTSEIAEQSEFNFVLQIARVFCRMGCHKLALDLVRSWSFDRPTNLVVRPVPRAERPQTPIIEVPTPPPLSTRRSSRFTLAARRQSSVLIDVDLPTRPTSPVTLEPVFEAEPESTESQEKTKQEEAPARQTGIGSLMKSAREDAKVPEFDMNSFF